MAAVRAGWWTRNTLPWGEHGVTVLAPPAVATAVAPVPTNVVTLTAPPAPGAVAVAPVPTVVVALPAPPAVATAVVPSPTTAVAIAAPPAVATAVAPVPTVLTDIDVVLPAPPAVATAVAPVPTTNVVLPTVPPAVAAAIAPAPTVAIMPTRMASSPGSGSSSGSRSPSTGTLTVPSGGWQVNDLIVLVVNHTSGTMNNITVPSGWFDLTNGQWPVNAGFHEILVLGHWITAAEVAAATTSWALTNLFRTSDSWRRGTSVWRGVDTTTPVGSLAAATGNDNSIAIPSITPVAQYSVAFIAAGADAVATSESIGSLSAPWIDLGSTYTNTGSRSTCVHGYRSNPNTAGVAVSPPALSITRSDNWSAITLELRPKN